MRTVGTKRRVSTSKPRVTKPRVVKPKVTKPRGVSTGRMHGPKNKTGLARKASLKKSSVKSKARSVRSQLGLPNTTISGVKKADSRLGQKRKAMTPSKQARERRGQALRTQRALNKKSTVNKRVRRTDYQNAKAAAYGAAGKMGSKARTGGIVYGGVKAYGKIKGWI